MIFTNFFTLASTTQQPIIATDNRPSTSVSSTGIQVLNEVVLNPPVLNPHAGADYGYDGPVYDMMSESQVDCSYFYGFENTMTEGFDLNGMCQ